jgi:hypothetical protein
MKSALTQSVVIAISFLSVFLWKESELALYTVPALGILTSFYLIATMRPHSAKATRNQSSSLIIVFLLNTSSLLLIQATGGLHSLLFFLLYFLAFYISFMLQAETVFLFTGAVLFFFLPEIVTGDTLTNVAKIASFLLLSPLAYFFGKEIVLHERQLKETKILREDAQTTAERIIKDVSDVVKNEGATLKEEDLAKLHEIVEESRQLEKEASQ